MQVKKRKYDKMSDEKLIVAIKKYDKSDDFIKRVRILSVKLGEPVSCSHCFA